MKIQIETNNSLTKQLTSMSSDTTEKLTLSDLSELEITDDHRCMAKVMETSLDEIQVIHSDNVKDFNKFYVFFQQLSKQEPFLERGNIKMYSIGGVPVGAEVSEGGLQNIYLPPLASLA